MAASARAWSPFHRVFRDYEGPASAAQHRNAHTTCISAAESSQGHGPSKHSWPGVSRQGTHNAIRRNHRTRSAADHLTRLARPLTQSAFFGSSVPATTADIALARTIIAHTCFASWPGNNGAAYGNGYDYDSRIPPQPNYIAFPVPTPPIDAQFLPSGALRSPPPQYYPQPPPQYYQPVNPTAAQQPVGVFWDIENSSIPKGARVGAVVRRIRAVAQQFG